MPTSNWPVVSIQAAGAPSAAVGHLGPGLLGSPSVVMAPGWVLEKAPARLEVTIGPPKGGTGEIEHIAARGLPDGRRTIMRVEGGDNSRAVSFLELERPSTYPSVPIDVHALAQPVLGQGPWRGLAAMVPKELRLLPDEEWLDLADAFPVPDVVTGSLEKVGGWICVLIRRCDGWTPR